MITTRRAFRAHFILHWNDAVPKRILNSLQYRSSIRNSITILLFWEFYTPVLADGISLEFEWELVSSSLRDSS